jgi:hypothetical protein
MMLLLMSIVKGVTDRCLELQGGKIAGLFRHALKAFALLLCCYCCCFIAAHLRTVHLLQQARQSASYFKLHKTTTIKTKSSRRMQCTRCSGDILRDASILQRSFIMHCFTLYKGIIATSPSKPRPLSDPIIPCQAQLTPS